MKALLMKALLMKNLLGKDALDKRTTCFIQSACNESQSYEILDVAELELYQYLREGRAIEDAATYSCDDTM
jgi:hypothetical protein